jgi:hypothetical protein
MLERLDIRGAGSISGSILQNAEEMGVRILVWVGGGFMDLKCEELPVGWPLEARSLIGRVEVGSSSRVSESLPSKSVMKNFFPSLAFLHIIMEGSAACLVDLLEAFEEEDVAAVKRVALDDLLEAFESLAWAIIFLILLVSGLAMFDSGIPLVDCEFRRPALVDCEGMGAVGAAAIAALRVEEDEFLTKDFFDDKLGVGVVVMMAGAAVTEVAAAEMEGSMIAVLLLEL